MQAKKITIALVLSLLLVGVGAAWFLVNRFANIENLRGETPVSVYDKSELRELLRSGADQKCTFSRVGSEGRETRGTAYMSEQRLRVEATSKVDGVLYHSNLIYNINDIYGWNRQEGETFAFTHSASADKDLEEKVTALEEQEMLLGKDGSYHCAKWSVDPTLFKPPADIDFVKM